MTSPIIEPGTRYTRLLVLGFHGRGLRGEALYKCRCDCGKESLVRKDHLTGGSTKSCGCYTRDRSRTHGMRRSREYASWRNMLSRCTNPNVPRYVDYGGRGIKVCDRWRKFENFLADMGEMPLGHSIERTDNDGNYEPGNCFWLPLARQSKNRRTTHKVIINGAEHCLADACRIINVSRGVAETRLYQGGLSAQEVIDSILAETGRTFPEFKERR